MRDGEQPGRPSGAGKKPKNELLLRPDSVPVFAEGRHGWLRLGAGSSIGLGRWSAFSAVHVESSILAPSVAGRAGGHRLRTISSRNDLGQSSNAGGGGCGGPRPDDVVAELGLDRVSVSPPFRAKAASANSFTMSDF